MPEPHDDENHSGSGLRTCEVAAARGITELTPFFLFYRDRRTRGFQRLEVSPPLLLRECRSGTPSPDAPNAIREGSVGSVLVNGYTPPNL